MAVDSCLAAWANHIERLSILTPGERVLIKDEEDALILADIKKMSSEELEEFQNYMPIGQFRKDYILMQIEWINVSKYFLGIRLGRQPSELEAIVNYIKENSKRYPAFCVKKYSDRFVRVDKQARQAG